MRKIRWGVMGTANIGAGCTIPGMQQADNCELYAIAGRNMEKAEQFKEKYHFQKAYGSYEELLADPEVEAVYIPLPNTLHYEWTIRALKSGKHVLCEKPLAPTEEQAKEKLEDKKVSGIYYVGSEPTLTVAASGIEESILQSVLQSYENTRSTVQNLSLIHISEPTRL